MPDEFGGVANDSLFGVAEGPHIPGTTLNVSFNRGRRVEYTLAGLHLSRDEELSSPELKSILFEPLDNSAFQDPDISQALRWSNFFDSVEFWRE